MAPYEALYGRKCRSPLCWTELGEKQLEGPDLIQETAAKVPVIQERLRMAFSRQKSYAYSKRRDVQYEPGDQVFLKVSPMKGVVKFGKRGKLNPRYIGPFEILERVGNVSYRLALPPHLSYVHPVFHISMLRKSMHGDPLYIYLIIIPLITVLFNWGPIEVRIAHQLLETIICPRCIWKSRCRSFWS
ncbi:hypothetical protein K2173_016423 [Erythroxylum novogranatense]|uniref:Tf2-1-like SH3-like domain-containing protein n=1 Tax=Erythroxylum novogranatense TaxID=1862640 RepID=A0AAV8SG82_9ROSI|nr:hypothetical protein K2173_016423 [Erythroxylum novogranatense]